MKKTKTVPPTPGSKEATELGCKCPVIDNHYGEGFYFRGKSNQFWISEKCKLHTVPAKKKKV